MKNLLVRLMDNGLLTLKSAENVLVRMEMFDDKFVADNDEDSLLKMEEILSTFLDSLKLTDDELDEITVGLWGNNTNKEMLCIMQTIIDSIIEEIEKD